MFFQRSEGPRRGVRGSLRSTPLRTTDDLCSLSPWLVCADFLCRHAIRYWGDKDRCLANLLWPTGVYWGPQNLDSWLPPATRAEVEHQSGFVMAWCLAAYIPSMMVVSYVLHRKGIYFKI